MNAFDKIIEATNSICYLESELMPFLKDGTEAKYDEANDKSAPPPAPAGTEETRDIYIKRGANFKLTKDFPLIADGIKRIQ